MASARRIGKREIAALQPGQTIWDRDISGFGARRQIDAVSYVLIYRTAEGRQRWHTIGRHGSPSTPDTARKEAIRLLGSVAGGLDPAVLKRAKRSAQSVAELCDLYLADAEAGRILTRRKSAKRASTLLTDKGRVELSGTSSRSWAPCASLPSCGPMLKHLCTTSQKEKQPVGAKPKGYEA